MDSTLAGSRKMSKGALVNLLIKQGVIYPTRAQLMRLGKDELERMLT